MTLHELDAALARLPATPKTDADLEARHRLMVRRIELDQAARHAAANSRPQLQGNLVVNVPPSLGISHYHSDRGRVAQSRVTDAGLVVIDLFVGEFKGLLSGSNGLLWQNSNPDAMRALGQT